MRIADFGLSRTHSERAVGGGDPALTQYVATRWYRAPEVLLCCRQYSYPVDLWAVGSILAEMLARRPLFCGSNHLDQLRLIFSVIGSPTEEEMEVCQRRSPRCRAPLTHRAHTCPQFVEDRRARAFLRRLPSLPRRPASSFLPHAPPEVRGRAHSLIPQARFLAAHTPGPSPPRRATWSTRCWFCARTDGRRAHRPWRTPSSPRFTTQRMSPRRRLPAWSRARARCGRRLRSRVSVGRAGALRLLLSFNRILTPHPLFVRGNPDGCSQSLRGNSGPSPGDAPSPAGGDPRRAQRRPWPPERGAVECCSSPAHSPIRAHLSNCRCDPRCRCRRRGHECTCGGEQ